MAIAGRTSGVTHYRIALLSIYKGQSEPFRVLLNPDGSPGTTRIDDWSDQAVTGRQHVVAAQQNGWTAIFFDGQKEWFENPGGHNTLVSPGEVATVHPADHLDLPSRTVLCGPG